MPRAATTSDPFNAIAEPRRRHILEFIAGEERSVSEIADALDLNQPSVSKHLIVLRDVGLVTARRDGRRTMYRTNADMLRSIHEWSAMFEKYWRGQLRRIKAHAEAQTMTTTAQAVDQPTFTITEEILVRASMETTFASLIAQSRTAQRNPGRQAAGDDPRSQTRRPLVSRSRRRQRAPLGIRAEHQAPGAARDLGPAVHVDRDEQQPDLPSVRSRRRHADRVQAHAGWPRARRLPRATWRPGGKRIHARVKKQAEAAKE